MADTPNYRFYRLPRFSVNHVAEYITAENAYQRENVLREAKFPRRSSVIPYTISKNIIIRFLAKNHRDVRELDYDIAQLEIRADREEDGWMKSELRRNISALRAFQEAHTSAKIAKFNFFPSTSEIVVKLEGVDINARMDLLLRGTDKFGRDRSGAAVLFLANTDQSRRNIEDRRKIASAVIHWAMQHASSNDNPAERLCLSFDVFGRTVTPASKSVERLRANVRSSCREAATNWNRVEPPEGYDGPPWR